MCFANELSEMWIKSPSYLTSAPISVNVSPLLRHICSSTSQLTL